MNTKRRLLGFACVLALAAMPVLAGGIREGTFPAGSNADELVAELGRNWNVTEFDCRVGPGPLKSVAGGTGNTASLIITGNENAGECQGRQLKLVFGTPADTPADIDYAYLLTCGPGNTVTAAMGIDGGPLEDITVEFDFGPFSVTGWEGPIPGYPFPALGKWGVAVFVIGLLAAGAFLIRRFG